MFILSLKESTEFPVKSNPASQLVITVIIKFEFGQSFETHNS